jgi:hypothetical protein
MKTQWSTSELQLLKRYPILRVVAVVSFSAFSLTSTALAADAGAKPGRAVMIFKPVIHHPSLPSGYKPEGSGVFVCHVDTKTGRVK